MDDVVALVLAGGTGRRMGFLTEECCKPALTYGGKYRIIDFALSNCANSGILQVALAVQYLPRQLLDHVGRGEPWGLDRGAVGLTILQPSPGRGGGGWYEGTIGAVLENLDFLEERGARDVVVASGSQIGRIDSGPLLEMHRAAEADCTIGAPMPPKAVTLKHRSRRFEGAAVSGETKDASFSATWSASSILVFRRKVIEEMLGALARDDPQNHDLTRAGIERISERYRVQTFPLHNYVRDIDTIASYYQAHQDLLLLGPPLVLGGCGAHVGTRSALRPPAWFGPHSKVDDSLVSEGALIEGTVRRSVVSPGVRVCADAVVEDSVLLEDVVVSEAAVLRRCVVDKGTWIGPRAFVGEGSPGTRANHAEGERCAGVTVVGRNVRVPGGIRIGCSCQVGPGAREVDFQAPIVGCGDSVFAERLTHLWMG